MTLSTTVRLTAAALDAQTADLDAAVASLQGATVRARCQMQAASDHVKAALADLAALASHLNAGLTDALACLEMPAAVRSGLDNLVKEIVAEELAAQASNEGAAELPLAAPTPAILNEQVVEAPPPTTPDEQAGVQPLLGVPAAALETANAEVIERAVNGAWASHVSDVEAFTAAVNDPALVAAGPPVPEGESAASFPEAPPAESQSQGAAAPRKGRKGNKRAP